MRPRRPPALVTCAASPPAAAIARPAQGPCSGPSLGGRAGACGALGISRPWAPAGGMERAPGSRQRREEMRVRPGDEQPGWAWVSAWLHLPVPGVIEAANPTAGAAGGAGGARGLDGAGGVPGYFCSGSQRAALALSGGGGQDGGVPVAERRRGAAAAAAAGRALGAGRGAVPARPGRMEAPAWHPGAAG